MCEEERLLPWSSVYPERILGESDCELKEVLAKVQDLAATTMTTNHNIDLLAYFQTTWIQGLTTASGTGRAKFPPSTWNAYERSHFNMNRTNNVVESWNKKFSALVGHANPTIYNFIAAVQMEHSSTDKKILANSLGEQPPKRKKANSDKDRRIFSIVRN